MKEKQYLQAIKRPLTSPATETRDGAEFVHPEIQEKAVRRLRTACWIVIGGFLGCIPVKIALEASGQPPLLNYRTSPQIAGVVVALSLALLYFARGKKIVPEKVLRLGLVYEVAIALCIGLSENLTPWKVDHEIRGISWICVWIVMYPLIVPTKPRSSVLASLGAACMGPMAVALAGAFYNHPAPPPRVLAYLYFPNLVATALAFFPALVVYRLTTEVSEARRMGSYELVDLLGHGGMGEVWRAKHRMLARPAAIKLVRPAALGESLASRGSTALRRFEREAQATAALQSPHTIDIYDFGITDDGTFYYVMELLEGVDLETLIGRFGPIPPERAVFLLQQACHSLEEAHRRGMIHRDIKPANIYVCPMGLEYDFVKVLDFGLVKRREYQEGDVSRLTMDGVTSGTPAYMSPETALGTSDVDARADLYALGCVAYWMLTGCLVFERETPLHMAMAHVQANPAPPSRRTELPIPESLERVLLSCLEKDADKRPQSAKELSDLLTRCELESPWNQERAAKWWRVHMPTGVHGTPPTAKTGSITSEERSTS